MSDLKQCPFCGGRPRDLMGYEYHKVSCSNSDCNLSGLSFRKEQWNTRITDQQLTTITKQRDELKLALSKIDEWFDSRALSIDFGSFDDIEFLENLLSTIKEQKGSN